MNMKAQIHRTADSIEDGIEAAAVSLGNGAETIGAKGADMQDKLREIGQRLMESTKALTDEAARQARLRPLAVFGVAFVAGIVIARVLRR